MTVEKTIEKISAWKCFEGSQEVHSHQSSETGTKMRFGLFLPSQAKQGKVPLLVWLSGLTCTEENFITKAGAQRVAAELGLAILAPDTSPRGLGHAGEDDAYDFGSGAGFYVDATQAPWKKGYRMYSYLLQELLPLVAANFPVRDDRVSISGHSMGGHGALTIALKNPARFKSVSAFAPIVAPSQVPWGEKALTGYLGPDRQTWAEHDATALVESRGWKGPKILIDQGLADQFLATQLHPHLFESACAQAGQPLTLRRHAGYDHGYYFIQSFMADHLQHHASALA